MVRLTCTITGWGTVRDPKTGERILIDSDLDEEQAERLADRYAPVDFDTDTGGSDNGDESDADEADSETCTVEMESGDICGRDRPCGYHD